MRTAICIAALAGIVYSQVMNLDAIAQDFPPPDFVKAPINVELDIPPTASTNAIILLESISAKKRDLERRAGDCSPYPAGPGPVPSPDTPAAFRSDPDFASMATNAPTPDGYTLAFSNTGAALQALAYHGLYTLNSYDTLTCASICDSNPSCLAFNVYIERDPSKNTNKNDCPNPPSTTNFRCTLWGAPVFLTEATNLGQYSDSFQVVIAGSNGYNKIAPPASVDGYLGPYRYGGAIDAPPESNTYMGYQYFPFSQSQGYDPQTCARACTAQTEYDSQHPGEDGSFMSCNVFNVFVLSKNGIPQGLYCSMYNESWSPSYATNYGQYRGSDRYTVSESYIYENQTYYSDHVPPGGILTQSAYTIPYPTQTTTSGSPTVTSTPSPSCIYPVIDNEGFEDGGPFGSIGPWVVTNQIGHTSYSVVQPGFTTIYGGKYAFDAFLISSNEPTNGTASLTLRQTLNTCPEDNYGVHFSFKLPTVASGTVCSISLPWPYNQYWGNVSTDNPVFTPGQMGTASAVFLASGYRDNLDITITCGPTAGVHVQIDNVKITPFASNTHF